MKIKHQCDICGYGKKGEWSPQPRSVRQSSGCPKCSYGAPQKKTYKNYCLWLLQNKRTITPLGEYKDTITKIEHQCDICGYGKKGEWSPSPNLIKCGKGCPRCASNRTAMEKYHNKPTYLYYIHIKDQFKIGIVRRYHNKGTIWDAVKGRYSKEIKSGIKIEIINGEFYEDGYLAFQREQYIIQGFKNHQINKDEQILNSGYTETFTHDVLN